MRMFYNAIIIGAGVAGNRVAEILSKKGLRVLVVEEHLKVGLPKKCTGLVSQRIKEILPNLDEEIFLNEIRVGSFIFGDKTFELRPKTKLYVIDRVKLDHFLFERASSNGAEYKFGERFTRAKVLNDRVIVETTKGRYEGDILIGADGAFSTVAKNFGLFEEGEFFIGLQSTVKGNYEKDRMEIWFGEDIAPNFFAWVVPLDSKNARVGLATKKNTLLYLKKFMRKRTKTFVEPDTCGIIKFGLIKKTVSNRVLLVGDAAMQVKPFTGGGIIYSLIASEVASLSVLKAFKNKNYTEKFLTRNYEKIWREKLESGIRRGLMLRKIFYSFSDISIYIWFSVIPYFKTILENIDYDLL
ncbi:MAG: NAD(P)/FAD-dependent oxidoreductase [Candidatus Aenigmarchaeota archaeon]|nr:NAD(P)/FAD-dependent oxidoreductase [Candidatus Aenigmarchaeota archaeon]